VVEPITRARARVMIHILVVMEVAGLQLVVPRAETTAVVAAVEAAAGAVAVAHATETLELPKGHLRERPYSVNPLGATGVTVILLRS
jgi:hypothetical protein